MPKFYDQEVPAILKSLYQLSQPNSIKSRCIYEDLTSALESTQELDKFVKETLDQERKFKKESALSNESQYHVQMGNLLGIASNTRASLIPHMKKSLALANRIRAFALGTVIFTAAAIFLKSKKPLVCTIISLAGTLYSAHRNVKIDSSIDFYCSLISPKITSMLEVFHVISNISKEALRYEKSKCDRVIKLCFDPLHQDVEKIEKIFDAVSNAKLPDAFKQCKELVFWSKIIEAESDST